MNKYDYLARFREPSTWAGLAILAGLFGVQIAPADMQAVIQIGTGIAGGLAVLMPEKTAAE